MKITFHLFPIKLVLIFYADSVKVAATHRYTPLVSHTRTRSLKIDEMNLEKCKVVV